MRFLSTLFGGLVGAVPGLIISDFTGENLLIGLLGLIVGVVGLIIGLVRGWQQPGWLSRQGVLGALIGVVPGLILWPLDLVDGPIVAGLHWKEIMLLVIVAGFLLGLFIGNRRGHSESLDAAAS